ncbi:hypothetical protein FRX31_030488 [Thalictrum thalictroides]|uniref:Uncharacterized protein n=1 Tax=Thalictrum thalictroides TaxID=46969 RepID=A0A7J6V5G5_THATH|nr:hypothetical protein FRX31_030488 [Thalictrum thalictroides]
MLRLTIEELLASCTQHHCIRLQHVSAMEIIVVRVLHLCLKMESQQIRLDNEDEDGRYYLGSDFDPYSGLQVLLGNKVQNCIICLVKIGPVPN